MTDSPFDELPGDLMIWVLIVSELVAFGAGLAAFLAMRIGDPAGFAAAQAHLHATAAGANTLVLVTSGYLAALAVRRREAGRRATLPLLALAAAPAWARGFGLALALYMALLLALALAA